MRILNKKARYGTIHGSDAAFPEAKYHQNGAMFNAAGNCLAVLTEKGPVPYTETMDKQLVSAGGSPEEIEPQQQLDEKSSEIDKLKLLVASLERDLDAAKAGDITNPDFTANCAQVQKNLTNAKRSLTKAINAAAVIETQMNKGDEK